MEAGDYPALIIEFVGGPLDGKNISSDEAKELDPSVTMMLLTCAAAELRKAEKEERPPGELLTWRLPSPVIAEKAKSEGWSPAKRNFLLEHYIYKVREYQEAEGIVIFKARFERVE